MSQNSAVMSWQSRHFFLKVSEMEGAHMDQTKDLTEEEKRVGITGFTKAGKSWISHPIALPGKEDALPAV